MIRKNGSVRQGPQHSSTTNDSGENAMEPVSILLRPRPLTFFLNALLAQAAPREARAKTPEMERRHRRIAATLRRALRRAER